MSVFITIPNKGNAKECSNYCTIACISHASKVILRILQAMLQQSLKQELPHVQAECQRGRGTRDQIANIYWIMEKARAFQKNIYFCFFSRKEFLRLSQAYNLTWSDVYYILNATLTPDEKTISGKQRKPMPIPYITKTGIAQLQMRQCLS